MKEFQTASVKETPPYGAFDDYVYIEAIENMERFAMRPEEFEFLTNQLFDNWMKRDSKYIQILKEWNECIGFNDLDETPSIILDIQDTIEALSLTKGSTSENYIKMTQEDLQVLIKFLKRNQQDILRIRQE